MYEIPRVRFFSAQTAGEPLLRLQHSSNASSSMCVTLSGIDTLPKRSQHANAASPISVTPSGMTTQASAPVYSINTPFSILKSFKLLASAFLFHNSVLRCIIKNSFSCMILKHFSCCARMGHAFQPPHIFPIISVQVKMRPHSRPQQTRLLLPHDLIKRIWLGKLQLCIADRNDPSISWRDPHSRIHKKLFLLIALFAL